MPRTRKRIYNLDRLFLLVTVRKGVIPITHQRSATFLYNRLGERTAILLVDRLSGTVDIITIKQNKVKVINRLYAKETND